MLLEREIEIINILKKHDPQYISSHFLAETIGKSIRTIQQDLHKIKEVLPLYGAELEMVSTKGYRINIINEDTFQKFIDSSIMKNIKSVDSQSNRIYCMLKALLNCASYIKADTFCEELFASKSTINNDIKELRHILEKYHLILTHKPYYGLCIEGEELNKRNCMMNEVLAPRNFVMRDDALFKEISDITSDCLIRHKYKMDDVALMNLLMHIYTNIKRIKEGNLITFTSNMEESIAFSHDVEMATEIYDQMAKKLHFSYSKDEVLYLAVYIQGKRNYESKDLITSEINALITDMLLYVKEKCNIDFSYDIEFRIGLALHFLPLRIRVRNNMQLKNPMLNDIKLNFTFAYELATVAGAFLARKYHLVLSENELSYLAIHFNIALDKQMVSKKPKRILVICSSRISDSLLLKYTFHKWFEDLILEMDILNLYEISENNLKKYDVIFTTDSDETIPKEAIKINYFLNDEDYKIIKKVLQNEENEGIGNFFDRKLFLNLNAKTQNEVIKAMCDVASKYKKIDGDLYASVLLREQYGSTAFGNLVAMPHPNALISEETFVVTAILDKPLLWGEQEAQLIFLICIEKENEKDLKKLFGTIARILPNCDIINEIIHQNSYDWLYKQLNIL